jgi:hypothetical protein
LTGCPLGLAGRKQPFGVDVAAPKDSVAPLALTHVRAGRAEAAVPDLRLTDTDAH